MRIGKLTNRDLIRPYISSKCVSAALPPPSKIIKPKFVSLSIRKKELTPDELEDHNYDRLIIRLCKKLDDLQAAGLLTEVDYQLFYKPSPQRQQRRGIMDNIGDIFECSYEIPPSPKRYEE